MPASPSPRPSVIGTNRSAAFSSGMVGTPSTSARSISTISDQRAATASGSSHWISAAVIADTRSVRIGLLPVRTGRAPRPARVARRRPAGRSRGTSRRCPWVQLHVDELVVVELADDADAELVDAGSPRRVVVGLRDDHVAAGTLAPLEEAGGGDVRLQRGDDLQQLGADRQQRVVQPQVGDLRVVVADGQPEDGHQLVGGGEVVRRDEGDLAESEHRLPPVERAPGASRRRRRTLPCSRRMRRCAGAPPSRWR